MASSSSPSSAVDFSSVPTNSKSASSSSTTASQKILRPRRGILAKEVDVRTPEEIEVATNNLLRRWGVRRFFTRYDSFDTFADVLKAIGVCLKYEDVSHTVKEIRFSRDCELIIG